MTTASLTTLLVFAAAMAGFMIASQGIINGRLASEIGGPLQAALVSFTVGWVALLALNLALRHSLPTGAQLSNLPPWAWLGGLLGAVMVGLAAFAVPKIGVATYVSGVIAGQLSAAILYDHIGFLGQSVREATPLRLLGVVILVIGVYMIRRF